jgi:cell division protein FtsQ
MKRFFQILLFSLFTASVVALMVYVYINHIKEPLKKIEIQVARPTEKGFVNKEEIYNNIKQHLSDTNRLKDIDINLIEESLAKNPWIDKTDAYTDIDGNLIVNIKESVPVLRIFNQKGNSFYLDKKGKILPVSKKYVPRLLIANGYIKTNPLKGYNNINDTVYKTDDLKKLLFVVKKINRYPFLQSLISEIYLNSKNEFDLIPIVGNQTIRLGDTTDINHKLENLIIFYKKALVYEGWDKYKTVNLKYRNQIVCTKN